MSTPSKLNVLDGPQNVARWLRSKDCGGLSSDSRELRAGDAFFAWPGASRDARGCVRSLLSEGRVCVADAAPSAHADLGLSPHPNLAIVRDLKAIAGEVADCFHGQASHSLAVVAVTGTNGKTSTAWWLSQALAHAPQAASEFARHKARHAESQISLLRKIEHKNEQIKGQSGGNAEKKGLSSLMVGTLGVGQPPLLEPARLTTPDALSLHRVIAQAAELGASSVVMEASSIGLAEHRLAGVAIDIAVFTNFTQDHLDYHGSMDAYWQAKRELFAWPSLRAAVVNVDDPKGESLMLDLRSQRPSLALWPISVSAHPQARLHAQDVCSDSADGTRFAIVERDPADGTESRVFAVVSAFGMFNVSNLLGVVAAQRALGVNLEAAAAGLAGLLPVPGRLERVVNPRGRHEAPLVLVDYAHTPDALAQTLTALRTVANQRLGRVHCVFGCGGDRDRTKRAAMAGVVERIADAVTLTQDNPRTEPPDQIAADALSGFANPHRVRLVQDRASAIGLAIAAANAADVVLIAGKGHEDYQDIMGVKYAFSDRACAAAALGVWVEGAPL